jgi:RecJ-like exonuclease
LAWEEASKVAEEICADCNGAGKIDETCSWCLGKGKRGNALHDFDRDEEDDCSHCGGSGYMEVKCPSCVGSGSIFTTDLAPYEVSGEPDDLGGDEEEDAGDIDTDEEEDESLDHKDEDEEEIIIRAKWVMDGAATLDEAIQKLNEYSNYLEELKNQGYELCDPIEDDYGFLQKM